MFVDYDSEVVAPRHHPWTVVEHQPDARYWDFRKHPELIPLVLEDFKPWQHYPAIKAFYTLLTWLNGPDSHFETNDCGLIPPKVDVKTPPPVRVVFKTDPIGIHGRVTVLFRNLALNAAKQNVDWLKKNAHDLLKHQVENFPAVIFFGEWPHLFVENDKQGNAVVVKFWAWGEDETSAMANLGGAFSVLLELFQHLNKQITATMGQSAGL
ncbi:MAG TPA: hypothetical protein VMV19_11165 [Xanthobacteraceae bacterium]|nr:hypothetical protein [Xanthobacteraceae bacterium]